MTVASARRRASTIAVLAQDRRHDARRATRLTRIVLVLLGVTLVKQIVHALAYPPFQGHDEVAHLGYLRSVARLHQLPTLSDRLPQALAEYSRFTLDWPALYTANHPPLYYVVAAPVYLLAGDSYLRQLYAVRLVAIPFLLVTIWLSFRIASTLVPDDGFVALTVPAVVAMQPQLAFEGAIVNNDIVAVCFGALILYLVVTAVVGGLTTCRALALGLSCGFGLLTKATLVALLPVVAAAVMWCVWPRPTRRFRERAWWRATLAMVLAVAVPAFLLLLPWYLYLRSTYGDFTAFEATRELQADWNHPAGSFSELLTSSAFHAERIKEAWGFYGWKLLPLTDWELRAVHTALCVVALGLCVGLVRWIQRCIAQRSVEDRPRVAAVALLAGASVLMYGAMIYFGTMFLLTQARYFFPILPAAAVLAMLGVRELVPVRARVGAAALVIAAVSTFQLLLLTRLVLPYALI